MSAKHMRDGLVIETSFDYPPIPVRDFDWSAVTDNYDGELDAGFQPVGRGRTEEAAIADLLEQIKENAP